MHIKYLLKGETMRRFILLFAAVLSVVAFIAACLANTGSGSDAHKLVIPEEMPAFSLDDLKEGLGSNKYIKAYISDVTDGDTLEIVYRNEEYKVRLLCIDTPESVKQGVKVQPYALEASELTKKLTLHKNVRLVFEKGLRDRYGRLLAYIILENGQNLNALLVRNGYARVEVVSPNKSNEKYFLKLQNEAIRDHMGMWGLDDAKQPFVKDKDGDYIPRYWEKQKAS